MDKAELLRKIGSYYEKQFPYHFEPGVTYIPTSYPTITKEDIMTVASPLLNGWFTEHIFCGKFSKALKKVCEKKNVQLCNSGSSASLLAMSALARLKDPKKKFVITCATAFPTTVYPIYQNNLIPIFIDIDKETLEPLYAQLSAVVYRYKDEIAGAVFTHTLGFPYDERIIKERLGNIVLISDCCDALGAYITKNYKVKVPVGHFAEMLTLSFFPSHHICTTQGGAVLTDDDDFYAVLRSKTYWGRSCWCLPGQDNTCGMRFNYPFIGDLPKGYDHKYVFDELGYNLQMTDLQGAMGYSQIQRLESFASRRYEIFSRFREELKAFGSIRILPNVPYLKHMPSPFGIPISVKENASFSAKEFISYLESKKIGTRRIFAGNIIRQPALSNMQYIRKPTPGSDYLMNNAFWIGCYPSLTDEMVSYMIQECKTFLWRK